MTDVPALLAEQDRKRLAFERKLAKKLAGDDVAAERIRQNFQPLVDFKRDMSLPSEPDDPIVHTRERWTPGEKPS